MISAILGCKWGLLCGKGKSVQPQRLVLVSAQVAVIISRTLKPAVQKETSISILMIDTFRSSTIAVGTAKGIIQQTASWAAATKQLCATRQTMNGPIEKKQCETYVT
jgi:hypothetical protein